LVFSINVGRCVVPQRMPLDLEATASEVSSVLGQESSAPSDSTVYRLPGEAAIHDTTKVDPVFSQTAE